MPNVKREILAILGRMGRALNQLRGVVVLLSVYLDGIALLIGDAVHAHLRVHWARQLGMPYVAFTHRCAFKLHWRRTTSRRREARKSECPQSVSFC